MAKKKTNKKKQKRAFTLIELLAVIVILAIIALIATPIVMNLINKARKSAAEDSAYGMVKAAETYYAQTLLETSGNGISEDLIFPCTKDGCKIDEDKELTFNGSKPSSGTITIKTDGKVEITDLIINNYKCNYKENSTEIECLSSGEKPTTTTKLKEILAESIIISGDTEMAKGQSMTLAATISPSDTTNKTVTWSSSDTSVATIDENGNVTSVNGGTATITATTSNGKTATFNITVNSYLKVVYLDPTDLSKTCTKADVNTSSLAKNGCMKWYAYQDTGSNYKMLLDHAVFERIDMEDYSSYLSSLTSSYGWKVTPTSIDASYLAGTVNRTTSNYEGSRPAAFESWLRGIGGNYWTSTSAGTVDGESAYWQVYADGYMYIIWMWDQASIRPVITISKDNVNVK